MIQITSIKRKNDNKYEVIIKKEKHIIYGDVLLEFNLLSPKTINEKDLEKLLKRNEFYENYHGIMKFIRFKMRSEKEVITKLKQNKVSKENTALIIQKLKEENYLNNEVYLKSYVQDQITLTLNGPYKIKDNLLKLGFKEDDILNSLSKYEDKWKDRVEKITTKKIKTTHNISSKMFRLKLKKDLFILGYDTTLYEDIINNAAFDDRAYLAKEKIKLEKKYAKYDENKKACLIKNKLYTLGYDIED